jgi:hypothetical protein
MNRRVSVWKYVRIGKKWRYCKPAVGKNGKIKPDSVIVRGKEERHPEGNFYLHRYDGNKEIGRGLGPMPKGQSMRPILNLRIWLREPKAYLSSQ